MRDTREGMRKGLPERRGNEGKVQGRKEIERENMEMRGVGDRRREEGECE